MAKTLTEINATVEVTFSVMVEHDEDEDISEENAQRFVDELTPRDWFDWFGAGQPSIDLDIGEPYEPEKAKADIAYKEGRFVSLEERGEDE
ncbi:MAG: hypothetical protein K2Y22_04325 [Candidatus Obscuribacterales bacterium]|nr:hypothetical protein [Candidatus Obscuribacterales bacterium]